MSKETVTPATDGDLEQTKYAVREFVGEENSIKADINDLAVRIHNLSNQTGIMVPVLFPLREIDLDELDVIVDGYLLQSTTKVRKFPKLSVNDSVVSCTAGVIAVIVDVLLVGTPEVVKVYKGGENFDGSILTKAIRKLGEGKLGGFCSQFEKICKVPYDISIVKDGMTPNNHRLRSFSHDPFFGLFFSVFDIIMNTTTFIDNAGCLRILPNTRFEAPFIEKLLCVFYYLGHIVSDVFTARGVPIPGFFLTQFFTGDGASDSIARIAEGMYKDGYDLRHFASMSAPVAVKGMIISIYLKLSETSVVSAYTMLPERDKAELEHNLKKLKMNFIADSIAISGNVAKFFAPPYSCNPCSINAVEWLTFIKSGANMLKMQLRDVTTEVVLDNRAEITAGWLDLGTLYTPEV